MTYVRDFESLSEGHKKAFISEIFDWMKSRGHENNKITDPIDLIWEAYLCALKTDYDGDVGTLLKLKMKKYEKQDFVSRNRQPVNGSSGD